MRHFNLSTSWITDLPTCLMFTRHFYIVERIKNTLKYGIKYFNLIKPGTNRKFEDFEGADCKHCFSRDQNLCNLYGGFVSKYLWFIIFYFISVFSLTALTINRFRWGSAVTKCDINNVLSNLVNIYICALVVHLHIDLALSSVQQSGEITVIPCSLFFQAVISVSPLQ